MNYDVDWDAGETESYNDGHGVLVDPNGLAMAGVGSAIRTMDYYLISFYLSDLGISSDDFDLGLSWSMTCANDIIQGSISNSSTPVPESATMLLF